MLTFDNWVVAIESFVVGGNFIGNESPSAVKIREI